MPIEMFTVRYHFQFNPGIWRSVLGHNDLELAREWFEQEKVSATWGDPIRLFDTLTATILDSAEGDPTGGITLDELSFKLADGQTAEEIQNSLESAPKVKIIPEGLILPFNPQRED